MMFLTTIRLLMDLSVISRIFLLQMEIHVHACGHRAGSWKWVSDWVKNICINSELILTIVLHEGRDYCPPPTNLHLNMFLIFVNLVDKNGILYFYLHSLY